MSPAVLGVEVDDRARCAHWRGPTDIVALRFPCCDRYFACHECHLAVASHPPERWPRSEFGRKAVLCGACGNELTIREYLASANVCPSCDAGFNPRCAAHHPLYFEL